MADPIPAGDLPRVTPGAFDSVVGVDEATGAARRFPMPISGSPKAYETVSDLPASADEGTPAYVNSDPTAANNGLWAYLGGVWVQSADRTTGLEGRVSSAESDIGALEAIDAGARLTAEEAATVAADGRLDALETIDAGPRLTQAESALSENAQDILALEAINAGARLTAAEAADVAATLRMDGLDDVDAALDVRTTSNEAELAINTPRVEAMFNRYRYRDTVGEFDYSVADAAGRVPWGIRRSGDVFMAGAEMPVHHRDSSQVLWGIEDSAGNLAIGIARDGSVLTPALRVQAGEIYRDYSPAYASINDDNGNAVLSWSASGEVDFLPSAELLDRMAGGGTIAPDLSGFYAYNVRSDGSLTFRTVQAPDQLVYDTVQVDASATDTQIVSGPGVIEGILYYGQSNAGKEGATGGTLVHDAKWPHHVFGFSAGPGQNGSTAVSPATLDDLTATIDTEYTPGAGNHFPATLTGFAIEHYRRAERSHGTFMRTDWYGGQPLSSFIRGTTSWDNLMASASSMVTACASYGREAQVRALVFVQGESGPYDTTYGTQLDAFIADVLPEIAEQTGQAALPLAILVQVNTQDDHTVGLSNPNIGQLDVARSRADTILAGPMYQCPLTDLIHPTPEGKMVLSEMIAQAYLAGDSFKPLWPTTATLSGNVITVAFDIPGEGLAFDSDWITAAVVNAGFGYSDSTSSATISSVAIVGSTVEITLSGTPTGASPTLTYGSQVADSTVDGWASGRGTLYSPTSIPSYYAGLGFNVPATLRHYCVKFSMGVTTA